MTVSKMAPNKLRIKLTDDEVFIFFGGYEGIDYRNPETRLALKLLLNEAVPDRRFLLNCAKMLVDITADDNGGCEIILTRVEHKSSARHAAPQLYLFDFDDSESMTRAVIFLYSQRKTRRLKSSLYKMPEGFRLLVTGSDFSYVAKRLNEYCARQSRSPLEAAYTREHGRKIAEKNAIERLGKAFMSEL